MWVWEENVLACEALNFAIKKSSELINFTKTKVLSRQITSIVNKIGAVHALKEEIEETKFTSWPINVEIILNTKTRLNSYINLKHENEAE